jgi:cysteinyl-tRNA synthetase
MSKSLNNIVMVSDLLKKYSPDVIRWYLISHHYRQPFEYFETDLEKANSDFLKISEYLNNQISDLQSDENIFNKFINALEDDLNTPLALEIISQAVQDKGSVGGLKKCLSLLGFAI